MPKPRKPDDPENHERWLVSYADFITLLFAFFVVMFASSQVNKKKVGSIAAYFESYIRDGKAYNTGITYKADIETEKPLPDASLAALTSTELAPVEAKLGQDLAAEIRDGKIALSVQPRGLVLSLRESAVFPPGKDAFNPEALQMLAKIAHALTRLPGQPIRLEGHTDNVPIETPRFPSNWELSAARANAILELLAGKFQIEPQRMAVAGYAEFHPLAANDSPEGRSHNRRVDIVLLSRSAAEMEPVQKKE